MRACLGSSMSACTSPLAAPSFSSTESGAPPAMARSRASLTLRCRSPSPSMVMVLSDMVPPLQFCSSGLVTGPIPAGAQAPGLGLELAVDLGAHEDDPGRPTGATAHRGSVPGFERATLAAFPSHGEPPC